MAQSNQKELENIILAWSSEMTGEQRDKLAPDALTLLDRLIDWRDKEVLAVLEELEGKNTIFKDYKYKDGVLTGTEIVGEGVPVAAIQSIKERYGTK